MPEPATVPLTDALVARATRGQAMADLLRPQSSRIAVGAFLAASVGDHLSAGRVSASLLLIVASYGIAAVLNDLADVETDRRNGRSRPLVTGSLTVADAHRVLVGCVIVVAGAQPLLRQPAGIVVTVSAALIAVTYSAGPRLQARGFAAPGLLAAGYLGLPAVLAVAQGATVDPHAVGAVMVSGAGVLLYKDLDDEVGDRATGKRTPLVRWGPDRVLALAALWVAAGAVVAFAGVGPGWWMLPMSVTVAAQWHHRRDRSGPTVLRWSWYLAALLLLGS